MVRACVVFLGVAWWDGDLDFGPARRRQSSPASGPGARFGDWGAPGSDVGDWRYRIGVARRTDPSHAWSSYESAHRDLRGWLAELPTGMWSEPSVLPGWTVADLGAHIALVADSIAALAPAAPGVRATSLADYVAGYTPAAESVAALTSELASAVGRTPDGVVAAIDERFSAAAARIVEFGTGDPVVQGRRGAIRLGEFLVSRVIEIVVHADDFARSLPRLTPPQLPRDAERRAVRALLDVLVTRAPGHTVEVRVPPYAAVQCVEGPKHTRGTPPNVVEMSPATWLRLATGRLAWAEALDDGGIAASGERADLRSYVPLF